MQPRVVNFIVATLIFFTLTTISFIIAGFFPPLFSWQGWQWGTPYFTADRYMFFGFFYLLLFIAILLQVKLIRKILFYRIFPLYTPIVDVDLCVGEILLINAYLILNVGYIIYFARNIVPTPGEPFAAHVARVIGHLNDINVSLLILPVTRYSIWTSMFGIPFERVIKYHRVVARVALLCIFSHLCLWWASWIYLGDWWNNVIGSKDGYMRSCVPINGTRGSIPGLCDWTIPYIEVAVFLTFLQAILALEYFRRNLFEVFYYSHHIIFPIFFVVANLHSWELWFYFLPGLALYLYDKLLLRWGVTTLELRIDSTGLRSKANIISVQLHVDHITQLTVALDIPWNLNWPYLAGQYAFLHIPAISLLQQHPFTISSAPSEIFKPGNQSINNRKSYDDESMTLLLDGDKHGRIITFHIKNMGRTPEEKQFTSQIEELAQKMMTQREQVPITIEGPYGNPLGSIIYPIDASVLVLIAGGIGITPVHSIYREIYLQSQNQILFSESIYRKVQVVHLLWVARTPALLNIFPDLEELATSPTSRVVKFVLELYATDKAASDAMLPQSVRQYVRRLRPNLDEVFNRILDSWQPNDVEGFFCGPDRMKIDLLQIAHKKRLRMHNETFLL